MTLIMIFSQLVSMAVMFAATYYLLGFLWPFALKNAKGDPAHALTVLGAGLVIHSLFHEGSELICGLGLHTGNLSVSLFAQFHVLLLGVSGAVLFLFGAVKFSRNKGILLVRQV